MDLLCPELLFGLLNEAQWVRSRDAGLSHFKEPRAFDVAVTLLVFLKEQRRSESTTKCCSGVEGEWFGPSSCSALQVQRFPAGMDNFTLERTVNRFLSKALLFTAVFKLVLNNSGSQGLFNKLTTLFKMNSMWGFEGFVHTDPFKTIKSGGLSCNQATNCRLECSLLTSAHT